MTDPRNSSKARARGAGTGPPSSQLPARGAGGGRFVGRRLRDLAFVAVQRPDGGDRGCRAYPEKRDPKGERSRPGTPPHRRQLDGHGEPYRPSALGAPFHRARRVALDRLGPSRRTCCRRDEPTGRGRFSSPRCHGAGSHRSGPKTCRPAARRAFRRLVFAGPISGGLDEAVVGQRPHTSLCLFCPAWC